MPNPIPSAELRRQLIAEGPVIVSFSRGKDAVAATLALLEDGADVRLYHLDQVPPGTLGFVDESIAYYEAFFGRSILRLPQPSFYRHLKSWLHQSPDRVRMLIDKRIIDSRNFAALRDGPPSVWTSSLEHEDIDGIVRSHFGDHWIATGVRAADSPRRRVSMMRHGPTQKSRRLAHVIWDWNIQACEDVIARSGVELPIDYLWFGRSFDGIDYRFTRPLRDHAPDDFERLCEWFPLIPADIYRHEVVCAGGSHGR